jgi:glycosyltransferase involved in cell wall biosynthesis
MVSSSGIIGFPHRAPITGGAGTFQLLIERELEKNGWKIVYANESTDIPDVILVVNGTRKIRWLKRCKKRGSRIVLRLDGLNWQHRVEFVGARTWIRSELINSLTDYIRRHLADDVVYQSKFIRDWWINTRGQSGACETVIYNSVDVEKFKPQSSAFPNQHETAYDLICVEGHVNGSVAYRILKSVSRYSTVVCGGYDQRIATNLLDATNDNLKFLGSIQRDKIVDQLRQSKIFLNIEIIPPCPNSVLEAMAVGLPVVGYDTGSLRELVGSDAGVLVDYGSNPWLMQTPNLKGLNLAIERVLDDYNNYSFNAKERARRMFNLDLMLARYLEILRKADK